MADALAAAGPGAPTLCEGWTARDLAAHLVARERRPDTWPGIAAGEIKLPGIGPALVRRADRVRDRWAERPFADLVELFRAGPPRWSPVGWPAVAAPAHLLEFFVHCEDVRRAGTGWRPRALPGDRQRALRDQLGARARLLLRAAIRDGGITLVEEAGEARADGADRVAGVPGVARVARRLALGPDPERLVVSGAIGELVLYAHGRPAEVSSRVR